MLQALWYIATVWLLIAVLHAFLQLFRPVSLSYRNFLNRHGLSVSLGSVRVYWTNYPQWVLRLGSVPGLRQWFDAGSVVGSVLLVASLPILAGLLIKSFTQPAEQQTLKPVIPGVTLPWSQMVNVGATVFVCAVVHELGHAVAAVKEQVRIDGYGVFVLLLYPGAYVDLHAEHMAVISAYRRLRIYCAGVWHNFILALLGLGLLVGMPHMMSPLFTTDSGIMVLNVNEESALHGSLPIGSHIQEINGCPVRSIVEFSGCLSRAYSVHTGHCLSLDCVQRRQRLQAAVDAKLGLALGSQQPQSQPQDCCPPSASDICFDYESTHMHQGAVCLNARNSTAGGICRSARHCLLYAEPDRREGGSGQYVCAKARLPSDSRLLRIKHTLGQDIMFVGNPFLIFHQVRVSSYTPRWSWVSVFNYLPIVLEITGSYLLSISSALCFFNAVPVYYLDGHWMLATLVEHFLPKYIPDQQSRNKLLHIILTSGTVLLFANALIAIIGAVR